VSEGPSALLPLSVMRPHHHICGVLLGPLATNRSISLGSGTIVEFCSEPIFVKADYPDRCSSNQYGLLV
jgi:hypothetical protein